MMISFLAISSLEQSGVTADWQKSSFIPMHTNFAVFMVLFMFCTIEAVIIKIATAANDDLDNSMNDEYEEDLYYEQSRRERRHNGIFFH